MIYELMKFPRCEQRGIIDNLTNFAANRGECTRKDSTFGFWLVRIRDKAQRDRQPEPRKSIKALMEQPKSLCGRLSSPGE
jgi:hypothetical protein